MNSFSQRQGIEPVKNMMQIESMDDELRTGLWNELTISYWKKFSGGSSQLSAHPDLNSLFNILWSDYFKSPLDRLDRYWNIALSTIRVGNVIPTLSAEDKII
jgi:hypothetical protein